MSRKFACLAFVMGALVSVWGGSTAVAAPASSSSTETSHIEMVVPATAASPAVTVECAVTQNNNPHYSKGANGVIAKAVVVCDYTLEVNLYGYITAGPKVGPGVVVADSNQTQLVTVGVPKTYYIPQVTDIAPHCVKTDYYQLFTTIQIVSPPGTIASGQSQKVLAGCP